MLAIALRSERTIENNIQIVCAFIALRQFANAYRTELKITKIHD
jgi:hypothetical protein